MANKPGSLNEEHKTQLVEWLARDLSTAGVQAAIRQYNREAIDLGKKPMPEISASTIRYYRRSLDRRIVKIKQDEGEMPSERGVLCSAGRAVVLRSMLERLLPYADQAAGNGRFTAAETILAIMRQIEREERHQGLKGDPQSVARTLTNEALREQIELLRGRKDA